MRSTAPRFISVIATLMLLVAPEAQAQLASRLAGQAVYDADLGVTWVSDANLPLTMDLGIAGIDGGGNMNWSTANSWVAALNAANYLGFNDWRLPLTSQPDSSCSLQANPGSGFPLQGERFDCTGSDMGHLSNVEGISSGTSSLFSNVQAGIYWSATSYSPDPTEAWRYNFSNGFQDHNFKGGFVHAWVLRTGDVGTGPPPASVPSVGGLGLGVLSGLLGIAAWRKLRP